MWNAFARFALRFYNFSSCENFKLGNLYELDVGDQLDVFSLFAKFSEVDELYGRRNKRALENNNGELFRVDTFKLCKFVDDLTKTRNSLCWLGSELSNFYLKLFKVVCSDSDPNWLHFEIVNTSISTANSLIAKGIDEAKNLIDNAVQKMFEFEKSGLVIEADVKFRVLFQKAKLFFFYEGQAAKYYNALLELERLDLPTSEANNILQIFKCKSQW